MLRTVLFLTFVAFSSSVKLPPVFEKCNRKQPDFKECVLKAAQNGVPRLTDAIPGLKLPSINPLEVEEATIGAGHSTVQVQQNFKKIKAYGFPDTKLNQFEFDFDNKLLKADILVPELKLKCDYELDGKVLLLPVVGKGPATIILKNLRGIATIRYEESTKKNKTYIKFVSSDLDIDPEHLYLNFENLFNGDKQLGDNINKVLNDNWKQVFEDVKGGYVEIVRTIVVSIINRFFSQVSMEEAFD